MPDNVPEFMIGLTHEAVDHVEKLRKWTLFLSVLGFIYIGFIIIFGFTFGIIMDSLGQEGAMADFAVFLLGFIYLVIGVVYFFPVLYLYRFSTHAKESVLGSDPAQLTLAFNYLKKHYVFIGVLAIIGIAFAVLGLIFGLFASLLANAVL